MGLSSKQVSGHMHKTLSQSQIPADQPKSSPSIARRQQQQQLEQLKCPRCDSTNTKFCYYNNYNKLQPRHYCRACKRHWTKGGNLRNVPVGDVRKNKRHKKSNTTDATATAAAIILNTQLTIQTQNHDRDHDLDQKSLCNIFYHQGLINPPTVNDGIFLGSSTTFSQNYLNNINPMSISTSLDMNSSPLFPTSYFQASDHHVHNYGDHDIDQHQEASITSSISNDQWQMPTTTTNCWNWDEIDTFNILSTDYDLNQISTTTTTTWDHDSNDIIKP